jgi:hypothetical protein
LILSKRDLYGAAIVHFLITIAVTLFHISNGISAFPDPSIELLFLLVQLPLAAVIYPLSWANPAATEFKVILLVLVANSMAASLAINSLRTLAKSGTEAPFARPPKVGWILAWSTALGIFLYGGRVEWSSLAPLSRVWNLVVLYFITTAAVSWLFLLQRRTKASPDTVVWRAVNGIVLVGFLLGTVQSSIDPIRLLFRAEGDTLDALLLQTLKEGRPLSDQFLVMGDLSDFNTAPARYRITTVPMAVLSVPTELHVGTKCYFTGQELTEMTPEEASDWVSNDAAVLQLTSSNVFASLDQVKQSLHDAAPSHEISLEEIARFLSRQKLCALRRLSFFGPFAAPVLPLIQAFPDDEATAIQVTETIRALSE